MSIDQLDNESLTDSEESCPLCMEKFDLDDMGFLPCPCGYRICRFCWHRVKNREDTIEVGFDDGDGCNDAGRCPACRQVYSDIPVGFNSNLTIEAMLEQTKMKRKKKRQQSKQKQKQQEEKQKLKEILKRDEKNLSGLRVVQKNLVFVIGIPQRTHEELRREFCKFGKIHKLVIGNTNSSNLNTAYVTYTRPEDAIKTIQVLNQNNSNSGQIIGGNSSKQLGASLRASSGGVLKASLGTTKYCTHWLKNQQCPKLPDCMYLHELADQEASFTKEDMQKGKHTEYEKKLIQQYLSKLKTTNGCTSINNTANSSNNSVNNVGVTNGTSTSNTTSTNNSNSTCTLKSSTQKTSNANCVPTTTENTKNKSKTCKADQTRADTSNLNNGTGIVGKGLPTIASIVAGTVSSSRTYTPAFYSNSKDDEDQSNNSSTQTDSDNANESNVSDFTDISKDLQSHDNINHNKNVSNGHLLTEHDADDEDEPEDMDKEFGDFEDNPIESVQTSPEEDNDEDDHEDDREDDDEEDDDEDETAEDDEQDVDLEDEDEHLDLNTRRSIGQIKESNLQINVDEMIGNSSDSSTSYSTCSSGTNRLQELNIAGDHNSNLSVLHRNNCINLNNLKLDSYINNGTSSAISHTNTVNSINSGERDDDDDLDFDPISVSTIGLQDLMKNNDYRLFNDNLLPKQSSGSHSFMNVLPGQTQTQTQIVPQPSNLAHHLSINSNNSIPNNLIHSQLNSNLNGQSNSGITSQNAASIHRNIEEPAAFNKYYAPGFTPALARRSPPPTASASSVPSHLSSSANNIESVADSWRNSLRALLPHVNITFANSSASSSSNNTFGPISKSSGNTINVNVAPGMHLSNHPTAAQANPLQQSLHHSQPQPQRPPPPPTAHLQQPSSLPPQAQVAQVVQQQQHAQQLSQQMPPQIQQQIAQQMSQITQQMPPPPPPSASQQQASQQQQQQQAAQSQQQSTHLKALNGIAINQQLSQALLAQHQQLLNNAQLLLQQQHHQQMQVQHQQQAQHQAQQQAQQQHLTAQALFAQQQHQHASQQQPATGVTAAAAVQHARNEAINYLTMMQQQPQHQQLLRQQAAAAAAGLGFGPTWFNPNQSEPIPSPGASVASQQSSPHPSQTSGSNLNMKQNVSPDLSTLYRFFANPSMLPTNFHQETHQQQPPPPGFTNF